MQIFKQLFFNKLYLFLSSKIQGVLRNKFCCFKENLYLCSPSMEALSYRPRNAGHDYYGRGTYLITFASEISTFNGEAKIIR